MQLLLDGCECRTLNSLQSNLKKETLLKGCIYYVIAAAFLLSASLAMSTLQDTVFFHVLPWQYERTYLIFADGTTATLVNLIMKKQVINILLTWSMFVFSHLDTLMQFYILSAPFLSLDRIKIPTFNWIKLRSMCMALIQLAAAWVRTKG